MVRCFMVLSDIFLWPSVSRCILSLAVTNEINIGIICNIDYPPPKKKIVLRM